MLKPKLEPTVIACLAGRDTQEVLYNWFSQTPRVPLKWNAQSILTFLGVKFHLPHTLTFLKTVIHSPWKMCKRTRYGSNYSVTSFLSTENWVYSISWWISSSNINIVRLIWSRLSVFEFVIFNSFLPGMSVLFVCFVFGDTKSLLCPFSELYMMLSGKPFSRWPTTECKLLNCTETSFRRALISNKTVSWQRIVGKSEKRKKKKETPKWEGGREGGAGLEKKWRNSVYSHFYTNRQPQTTTTIDS